MKIRSDHQRVLALDVRSQHLGYAIFAGPHTLLDWGVKNFRGGTNSVCVPFQGKVAQLLSEWQPAAVVLNQPASAQAISKAETVQTQARLFCIPFLVVADHMVRNVFREQRNTYERAGALAATFPELSSRLPRKRRPWQSEDYSVRIFEAVALGVTNFRMQNAAGADCLNEKNPSDGSLADA